MNFKIYKETKVQACWPHFDCHNEHSTKWRLSTSVICAVFYSKVLSNSLLATTPSTTSKRAFATPRLKGWTDCEAETFQLSWFTLTPAALSGIALGGSRWEVPQRHVASGLDWLAIHHPARAPSQHAYSHIQLFPYLPPNFYRETHHRLFSRFVPHGPSWIIRPQPEVEVDTPCSLLLAHTALELQPSSSSTSGWKKELRIVIIWKNSIAPIMSSCATWFIVYTVSYN